MKKLLVLGLLIALCMIVGPVLAASPVANINFATNGLPAGQSITVSWTKINPAGHSASGSTTFTSPGPSADEGTQPSTAFTFSFPSSVTIGSDTYHLISTSQPSPFTTGAADSTTTVTANYEKASVPVPEFPTVALPVAFIVGLIGTVLFIKSKKENE
jgi:hypothetical protein